MSRKPESKILSICLLGAVIKVSHRKTIKAYEVDDDCVVKSIENPFGHLHLAKTGSFHAQFVQLGVPHEVILISLYEQWLPP
jgi:hypothetical protein